MDGCSLRNVLATRVCIRPFCLGTGFSCCWTAEKSAPINQARRTGKRQLMTFLTKCASCWELITRAGRAPVNGPESRVVFDRFCNAGVVRTWTLTISSRCLSWNLRLSQSENRLDSCCIGSASSLDWCRAPAERNGRSKSPSRRNHSRRTPSSNYCETRDRGVDYPQKRSNERSALHRSLVRLWFRSLDHLFEKVDCSPLKRGHGLCSCCSIREQANDLSIPWDDDRLANFRRLDLPSNEIDAF